MRSKNLFATGALVAFVAFGTYAQTSSGGGQPPPPTPPGTGVAPGLQDRNQPAPGLIQRTNTAVIAPGTNQFATTNRFGRTNQFGGITNWFGTNGLTPTGIGFSNRVFSTNATGAIPTNNFGADVSVTNRFGAGTDLTPTGRTNLNNLPRGLENRDELPPGLQNREALPPGPSTRTNDVPGPTP